MRALEIVKNKLSYCYGRRVLMTDIDLNQLLYIREALEQLKRENERLKKENEYLMKMSGITEFPHLKEDLSE